MMKTALLPTLLALAFADAESMDLLQLHRRQALGEDVAEATNDASEKLTGGEAVKQMEQIQATIAKTAMNPQEKTLFVTLITTMEQSYSAELQTEHTGDETLWTQEKAKQQACHTNANAKFTGVGAVKGKQDQVEVLRQRFKACAKASKAWTQYQSAAATCVPAGGFMVSNAHDALVTAVNLAKTTAEAYQMLRPAGAAFPPASCDADQMSFETSFCDWRAIKQSTCTEEVECVGLIKLNVTKAAITGKATQRRASKLQFLTLKCKILHLLNQLDTAAVKPADTCEADTKLSSGDLELVLTMPTSQQCAEDAVVAVYPSIGNGAAFKAQEYALWSSEYSAPTNCVVTCEAVPAPQVGGRSGGGFPGVGAVLFEYLPVVGPATVGVSSSFKCPVVARVGIFSNPSFAWDFEVKIDDMEAQNQFIVSVGEQWHNSFFIRYNYHQRDQGGNGKMIEVYSAAWTDVRFELQSTGQIKQGDWFRLTITYADQTIDAFINGIHVPETKGEATSNYCQDQVSPPCRIRKPYVPSPVANLAIADTPQCMHFSGQGNGLKGQVRNFKWHEFKLLHQKQCFKINAFE